MKTPIFDAVWLEYMERYGRQAEDAAILSHMFYDLGDDKLTYPANTL